MVIGKLTARRALERDGQSSGRVGKSAGKHKGVNSVQSEKRGNDLLAV